MPLRPIATATLSVLVATPLLADDDKTVWRVFVADHAAPRITALDLSSPETHWTFETTGPSKLYATAGGEGIVAVQSDHDSVAFLNSGVRLESHGDHSDIAVQPPAVTGQIEGPRPFHVVSHDGIMAINFDKGGYATLLPQAAAVDGQLEGKAFRQSRAHHGFVAPMGNKMLSTVASEAPVEGDAAPPRIGLQAFDPAGTPVGEVATCTAIHGEAFSGAYLAAGCEEGILTVQETADGPRFAMLPYPTEFPEGTTGTLLGSTAMQVFLGNHGADGVVVVDPVGEPHMRRVALPFRRVDFALDPQHPQRGWVLTEDGSLHSLNLLDARIEASATLTAPYSMDGHWSDPRPRLALAGSDVLVTDPREGVLRVVDRETLAETAQIPLEGAPYNVVVVGGAGLAH
ncbi:MAG: ZinT/AdcA family metal-binding protein [Cereibacter sp.]|jgi:zinc transport system substrate-binding protein|nr:ZinT/AdcA family metal-binding protein [Cereibacter sp.]